jgi:hypothetical protein
LLTGRSKTSSVMMSIYWTIDLSAAMGQLLTSRPVGQGGIPAPSESVVKHTRATAGFLLQFVSLPVRGISLPGCYQFNIFCDQIVAYDLCFLVCSFIC